MRHCPPSRCRPIRATVAPMSSPSLVVGRADVSAGVLDGAEQVAGDLGALGRARPDGVAESPHGLQIGKLVRSSDSHLHAAECGTGRCRYGRGVDPEWHARGTGSRLPLLPGERAHVPGLGADGTRSLAGSVAIVQLADNLGTGWMRKAIGTALGLTGLAVAALAHHHWRANETAMRNGSPLPYTPVLAVLGLVLTVVLGSGCPARAVRLSPRAVVSRGRARPA